MNGTCCMPKKSNAEIIVCQTVGMFRRGHCRACRWLRHYAAAPEGEENVNYQLDVRWHKRFYCTRGAVHTAFTARR